jgi:outer membrane protein
MRNSFIVAIAIVGALPSFAQDAKRLSLDDAQAIALRNHPRISAEQFKARAAEQVSTETRAQRLPLVSSSLTGVGADPNSTIAAGNLPTSSLPSRGALGVTFSQMLLDFGRSSNLTKSAALHADAQQQTVAATRAQVLLEVRQAYFKALLAQSVLEVARETVAARKLILKQVSALAESQMRSSLDVSFAEVNVSEAELLLVRAENDIKAAFADLSAAMGYDGNRGFVLSEEPLPPALEPDAETAVRAALKQRPDLEAVRLQHQSALKFAAAERSLLFPTVSLMAGAGVLPVHDSKLQGTYSGAGLNVSIPVFNGSLFSARRTEAQMKAEAANQDVRDLEVRTVRDVKVAWLNAENAFRRLDVTARLLEQATRSLRLANSRYTLGLSSIVELSQAQLNQTSAAIASTSAKYDYQIQRALLDYETGALK